MARDNRTFLIVTGLSGAGKTQALKVFEDMGYFCVDNLPAPLVISFAELLIQSENSINNVCLVMDLRGESFFNHLAGSLSFLKKSGIDYEILYLEASDEVLVQRFKEARRQHPQNLTGDLLKGISIEREKLQELRALSNVIIDTSKKRINDLKNQILETWGGDKESFSVSITSFGYKYGIPIDIDLMMDVRFLRNPYYDLALRDLTGRDERVRDYVFQSESALEFLELYTNLLLRLLPQYKNEGKKHLSIGIGCTGGKHRSIATAIRLSENLCKFGYQVTVRHRDN